MLDLLTTRELECSDQYGKIWSVLAGYLDKSGKRMPERSSLEAWKAADGDFERVSLTGDLKFSTSPTEPLLRFQLKPLKLEYSFRLKRKYSGHRFLQVDMPGVSPRELPEFLKRNEEPARERIITWLTSTRFHLLGRQWRPFYSKPQGATSVSRKAAKFNFNEPRLKIFLFAEEGFGLIERGSNAFTNDNGTKSTATTVEQMIQWLIDVPNHQEEKCLKLYSRIALGVSLTRPTYLFELANIVRTHDAYADKPAVRALSKDEKSSNGKKSANISAVMNDGCARISKLAARHVADLLGLQGQPTPSAFQGRLGGAKGVWFVDTLDERPDKAWIEVTDSQLKYEWHRSDTFYCDKERRKFEVSSWSTPLSSARLNFQLMPILVNRGVSPHFLKEYLEADITTRSSRAEAAVDSARSTACWNQESAPLISRRKVDGSIDWQGGQPRMLCDQISLMVESGFTPLESKYLFELLYKSVEAYVTRIEERMNIGVSCSSYVLCIADPLAVLNEDEVHLGFSTSFTGEVREQQNTEKGPQLWSNTLLHEEDILVARSPAHLPSDIQRVRAVFKPELASLKDVIIFPSKGKQALADKLSGGDYDGDRVWVCWDPGLVERFCNAKVPVPTSPEVYGMKRDTTTVKDLGHNASAKMVQKGLCFAFQTPMLGQATGYLEKLNYGRWPQLGSRAVDCADATEIAQMLGHLVDAAKGGLSFTEANFMEYLKSRGLKTRLPLPAYKHGEEPKNICHPIDVARAQGKKIREKVLREMTNKLNEKVSSGDRTIQEVFWAEDKEARTDATLRRAHEDLRARLQEKIRDYWQQHAGMFEDEHSEQREGAMSFGTLVDNVRHRFVDLGPLDVDHPLVRRWKREHESSTTHPSPASSWVRLKATMLFCMTPGSKLPWYAAMRELCAVKAMASEAPTVVVKQLHDVMKVDTKLVRRLDRKDEDQMAALMEVLADDDPEEWIPEEDFLEAFDSMGLAD